MAIRKIFTDDAECLYKVCRPVEHFNKRLYDLLDDMAETMYNAEGVGLAAPQVGILRRVVVMDCGGRHARPDDRIHALCSAQANPPPRIQ